MLSCTHGKAKFLTRTTQPTCAGLWAALRLMALPPLLAPSTSNTLTHLTRVHAHRLLLLLKRSAPYSSLSLRLEFKWWFFNLKWYTLAMFPLNAEILQKLAIIYLCNDIIDKCLLSYRLNFMRSGTVSSLLSNASPRSACKHLLNEW